MIEALSASTGLIVGDPMFWIPLVFFFVLLMLMAGIVAFDGFDIGCGLLMPWLPELERNRVIDGLTNWRGANESWVLLFFAVFMTVYPMGWSSIFEQQFVPVLLLTVGCALRSLAFEFRARAPMKQQPFWNGLFSAGAYASASGLALWLARTVNGNLNLHDWVFTILVMVAMLANCVLMACCWILTWDSTALRQRAARIGAAVVRWVAAGMVAVSLILALTNPAVYYRWVHIDQMVPVWALWIVMLIAFVTLERQLRSVVRNPQSTVWWSPLALVAGLNFMMLVGIAYSYFPFLVLDELTVWDAAPTRESLRWMMAAVVVAAPVVLVFNVLGYWRLFRYKPVRDH